MDRTTRRTLLRTLRALTAVLTMAAALVLSTAPAQAAPSNDELVMLRHINQARAAAGLPAMVFDDALSGTARTWASHMAATGRLEHDPNLAARVGAVEPAWRSIGENVGFGQSVSGLHDAFMASPGHRANILGNGYNRVGIGFASANGRTWVTVRFLAGPAKSGTTGLEAPPAPQTRTATGDFDGDGTADMVVYTVGRTQHEVLFGSPDGVLRRRTIEVGGSYTPVAVDFDGDGRDEILWYAPGTAADFIWRFDGVAWHSTRTTIDGVYQPLAGDFDGDGRDDILWYAPGTAADYYWYGAPGGFVSVRTTINGSYQPVVGRLDPGRTSDIFWYAPGPAQDSVWYSTGRGRFTSVKTTVNGTGYRPFAADLDGDGLDDVFWYAPGPAADSVWYATTQRGRYDVSPTTVSGTYLPAAGDLNGDGVQDVLWLEPPTASGDPIWWGLSGRGFRTATAQVR